MCASFYFPLIYFNHLSKDVPIKHVAAIRSTVEKIVKGVVGGTSRGSGGIK